MMGSGEGEGGRAFMAVQLKASGAAEKAVSQWGQAETGELIAIRADLERDFTVARRNKTLWESVSSRMTLKGYPRTPDQCKCKWKNLVNRYKGKETGDAAENGRQCPFFEELQAVFAERARNMQRLLAESRKTTSKRPISEELISEEDEDEDSDEEQSGRQSSSKRRKAQSRLAVEKPKAVGELLQDFMRKQQQMESRWWDRMERMASERQRVEQDWRQSMENLERERLMLERTWREREEQRRMREECRAEKRDALFTALLNKLLQADDL